VAEGLREHTLLAKADSHPLAGQMAETREALQRIKGELYGGKLKGKGKGLAHRDISMHVRDLQQMEQRMTDELIGSAEVVCSTLIGCGCDALLQSRFRTVIIDEASQATEPRCLVAVQKCEGQLILVGDQQQLPPVVLCPAAERGGLKVSLFDRLLGSQLFERRVHMLKLQWPSRQFYGGELLDAPACVSDRHFSAFPRPVTLVDTSSGAGGAMLRTASARRPSAGYRLDVQSVRGGTGALLSRRSPAVDGPAGRGRHLPVQRADQ